MVQVNGDGLHSSCNAESPVTVGERRLCDDRTTVTCSTSALCSPQGAQVSRNQILESVKQHEEEDVGAEGALLKSNGASRLQQNVDDTSCSSSTTESLFPSAEELPPRPPRANSCNYTHWVALDVGKDFHDQYVYRHANGLCVIGLLPTHVAFKPTPAVTAVDFNVGKQSRADLKVSGKRKKNAITLEPNSVLCKVMVGESFYLIRCCVRGVLLEVNERLIKAPGLLNTQADTEGHIAIMMPRPEDWAKASKVLLTLEQYRERRGL